MAKQHGGQQEAGVIIITDPDLGVIEHSTRQCCHCQKTWKHVPGSGRIYGWCDNCKGLVCGPGCEECVPVEQMIENIEEGRDPKFRKTTSASIYIPRSDVNDLHTEG